MLNQSISDFKLKDLKLYIIKNITQSTCIRVMLRKMRIVHDRCLLKPVYLSFFSRTQKKKLNYNLKLIKKVEIMQQFSTTNSQNIL